MLPEEMLPRGKEPGCLSAWAIAQAALQLVPNPQAIDDHQAHCPSCAARLAQEQTRLAAARNARPPRELLVRMGAGGRVRKLLFVGLVGMALLAVGAWAVLYSLGAWA